MPYTTTPFRVDAHRDALLNLWREQFDDRQMREAAAERFAWLYGQNPLGAAQTWLAIDTDAGGVIGCASAFPAIRHIGERVVRTGITIDFAVDRRYRTAAVALSLQRALTQESRAAGFDCLLGRP